MFHGDDAMKNIGMVHKGGIGEGKEGHDQCTRVHKKSFELCLERGKAQREGCSIEARSS